MQRGMSHAVSEGNQRTAILQSEVQNLLDSRRALEEDRILLNAEASSATSAAQQYHSHVSSIAQVEVNTVRAEAQSVVSNVGREFEDMRAEARVQSSKAESRLREKTATTCRRYGKSRGIAHGSAQAFQVL